MKRILYVLVIMFIGSIWICFFANQPNSKNQPERIKIIVCFSDDVISSTSLTTQIDEINDEKIRMLLDQFDVVNLQAAFTNRYNNEGFLKPGIKNLIPENWQQIIVKDNRMAEKLVARLKNKEGILNVYIEKPLEFRPSVVPTDSEYGNQWHLHSASSPLADIDAEQAWDINTGRNDVIIAVCDGGVDYTHPDLDSGDRSRVIAGYDFGSGDNDPKDDLGEATGSYGGHGTHIAGIIGAIPNNEQVAGVMWNCKIMPVKMVGGGSLTISYPFGSTEWDFSTTAFPSDVADAIDYAVNNGAHVINLSYGFPSMGEPINEVVLRVPLLHTAILNAYYNNVVLVASMGNEYLEGNPTNYPAAFPEIIAVGNTTNDNPPQRWQSSSTGSHISVSAPGTSILSTTRGGGTGNKTGTSMSAPVVSGVAGLIISQGMDRGFNLINNDVRHILELTAVDIAPVGFDNETGFGIVNANNALQLLDEPNELYHYNSVGGSSQKVRNISKWILAGNYYGLAAGTYLDVDQYKITKHVTFEVPFCSIPQVWMRERQSACMSGASPNSGRPYSIITNVTTTGFDLEYFVYYVRSNTLGQTLNQWYPASPSISNVAYTAVGEPNIAATAGPLTGTNIICSSGASYTVQNLPEGATLTWEKSSNISLDSQQGSNPGEFSATSNGEGWIEATVSVPNGCETYTLPRKTVWVGKPTNNEIEFGVFFSNPPNNVVPRYQQAAIGVISNPSATAQNVTAYSWNFGSWVPYVTGYGSQSGITDYVAYLQLDNYAPSSQIVTVAAENQCGSEWLEFGQGKMFYTDDHTGYYYLAFSPNPATTETTLSIEQGSAEVDSPTLKSASTENLGGETEEWDIEVYDNMQSLKLKQQKLKNKSLRINTQNWKEGIYLVRAHYKDEIITGKLVVKK